MTKSETPKVTPSTGNVFRDLIQHVEDAGCAERADPAVVQRRRAARTGAAVRFPEARGVAVLPHRRASADAVRGHDFFFAALLLCRRHRREPRTTTSQDRSAGATTPSAASTTSQWRCAHRARRRRDRGRGSRANRATHSPIRLPVRRTRAHPSSLQLNQPAPRSRWQPRERSARRRALVPLPVASDTSRNGYVAASAANITTIAATRSSQAARLKNSHQMMTPAKPRRPPMTANIEPSGQT